MKKRAIIYGAGQNFINWNPVITELYDVIGVVDSSLFKQDKKICGFYVGGRSIITEQEYDVIVITPTDKQEIIDSLIQDGISRDRIVPIHSIYDDAVKNVQLKIALIFYGGMGDFLIGKNWLYNLINKYQLQEELFDIYIDSVAYDRGKKIFKFQKLKRNVSIFSLDNKALMDTDKYDAVIQFCIVPFVQFYKAYYIRERNKGFLDYILRIQKFGYDHYCHGFCHNSMYYKMIKKIMDIFPNKQYQNYCDIFDEFNIGEKYAISVPIEIDEDIYLNKMNLKNKKFITLDTGLNRDYKGGSSTRAWSHENWNELSKLLKSRIPEMLVVQVGEKMSETDDIEADIHLNGKTDLEEIKVLMKNASVHIDYDGGLVHIRHILNGGPSVVLFGSTAVQRHSYKENIAIRTDRCPQACEWTTEDWLFHCPRGFDKPDCMYSIKPQYVCDKVFEVLYD